jgi:hypothetical protein
VLVGGGLWVWCVGAWCVGCVVRGRGVCCVVPVVARIEASAIAAHGGYHS